MTDPIKQAARARASARKRNLPTNLTGREWLKTINDFQDTCAYCGGPNETLDHYIPMAYAGGTTVDNCVPSCRACNQRKASLHPRDIRFMSERTLRRVRDYLETRGRLYCEQSDKERVKEEITAITQFATAIQKEEESQRMTMSEFRILIQELASGKEIRILSDEQLRLQLQDLPGNKDGYHCSYSTSLTALEAYELGMNLLQVAYPSVIRNLQNIPSSERI